MDEALVSLDDPVQLLPVEIPKPWGREIWYTGIEARGESRVQANAAGVPGSSVPLSTYLAMGHERICQGMDLVLLKILDPLSTPVLGELYLEVHKEKQEVYVVTAVNADTWPGGRGRIRYGINQQLRQAYDSDEAFRAAFLEALGRYEALRSEMDEGRPGLEAAEDKARTATLAFTEELELQVGDVISVPTWVPHSLQQGVRVVEFQTPTYERFILSSSQKVLTQDHWDSAYAVAHLELNPPVEQTPEPLAPGVDRIVRFDDFSVWRAAFPADGTLSLPSGLPYAIAFCIAGHISLQGSGSELMLRPGEAALIPTGSVQHPVGAGADSLLLLAAPGL